MVIDHAGLDSAERDEKTKVTRRKELMEKSVVRLSKASGGRMGEGTRQTLGFGKIPTLV
jgi:hypothetical protein